MVLRNAFSEEERERIREEIVLREECRLEMRRRRNLQILPWMAGMMAVLSALAFLWRRLPV